MNQWIIIIACMQVGIQVKKKNLNYQVCPGLKCQVCPANPAFTKTQKRI